MPETVTKDQLAASLGLSPDYVRKQAKKPRELGGWPHFRIGRTIYFRPEHVAAIIAAGERNTDPADLEAHRRSGPSAEDLVSIGVTPRSAARRRSA